jgi:uncharacterized repeat protein (TIGR01451 family)
VGPLGAGAERRLQLEVQAVAPGELQLAPTATVTPDDILRTAVMRPALAVTVHGPETAAVGGPVQFKIDLANQTEAAVGPVRIYVKVPPGLYQRQAAEAPVPGTLFTDPLTLAAGESRSFPLEVTAAQTGRWPLAVWVAAEGEKAQAQARGVVTVTDPPLTVQVSGPRQAGPGRDLDFHIEVNNPNTVAATNVQIVQSVPQGLELVAATAGVAPVPGGQALQWRVGTLAPGQKVVVACKLRPRTAGDWPLYAAVIANNATEARASHTIHVDGAPPLTVEVLSREDVLTAGAESVCEVHVCNPAELPATNVRLAATLPSELEALPAQGPTAGRTVGDQVVFEPLPQLAPHADAVYRLRVRARQPGPGRVRVEVRADQLARPVVSEAGARIQEDPLRTAAAPAGSGARP